MRKLVIALCLLLFPVLCAAYGVEVENYTDIYGYNTAKGYRIYSATLTPTNTTAGSNTLVVASTSGKSIKVVAFNLTTSAVNNVRFKSATGAVSTTADTMAGAGMIIMGATSNIGSPITIIKDQPVILFKTATSGALYLNAASVSYLGADVRYFVE